MFHKIIAAACVLGVLSGCAGVATPQTLADLQRHQAQCRTGDQDACQWAVDDQQDVDREKAESAAQQNQQGAAVAAGVLGLLLGAAIEANSQPTYVIVPARRW